MFIKRSIAIFTLLFAASVLPHSLSAEDLFYVPGIQSPILDQGDTGTCFAQSAAELYSSWYRSRMGQHVSVSPLSAAYFGNKFFSPGTDPFIPNHNRYFIRGFDGGDQSIALNVMTKKLIPPEKRDWFPDGVCLYSKMPNGSDSIMHFFAKSIDVYQQLQTLADSFAIGDRMFTSPASVTAREILKNKLKTTNSMNLPIECRSWCNENTSRILGIPSSQNRCLEICDGLIEYYLDRAFDPNNFDQSLVKWAKEVIQKRNSKSDLPQRKATIRNFLRSGDRTGAPASKVSDDLRNIIHEYAMNDLCEPFVKPSPEHPKSIVGLYYNGSEAVSPTKWGNKLEKFIDKYLRHQKLVSISIIVEGLIQPLNSDRGLEGAHVVTIIGKRKVNNAKYYIVKNSWGDSWSVPSDVKAHPVTSNGKEVKGLFALPAAVLYEPFVEMSYYNEKDKKDGYKVMPRVFDVTALSSGYFSEGYILTGGRSSRETSKGENKSIPKDSFEVGYANESEPKSEY